MGCVNSSKSKDAILDKKNIRKNSLFSFHNKIYVDEKDKKDRIRPSTEVSNKLNFSSTKIPMEASIEKNTSGVPSTNIVQSSNESNKTKDISHSPTQSDKTVTTTTGRKLSVPDLPSEIDERIRRNITQSSSYLRRGSSVTAKEYERIQEKRINKGEMYIKKHHSTISAQWSLTRKKIKSENKSHFINLKLYPKTREDQQLLHHSLKKVKFR